MTLPSRNKFIESKISLAHSLTVTLSMMAINWNKKLFFSHKI